MQIELIVTYLGRAQTKSVTRKRGERPTLVQQWESDRGLSSVANGPVVTLGFSTAVVTAVLFPCASLSANKVHSIPPAYTCPTSSPISQLARIGRKLMGPLVLIIRHIGNTRDKAQHTKTHVANDTAHKTNTAKGL